MSETNQRSEPSREEEARQLYLQWGGQDPFLCSMAHGFVPMELECPLSLLAPFKLPALRPPKSFLDCQQVVQREMVRKLLEVIAEAVGSKQEWADVKAHGLKIGSYRVLATYDKAPDGWQVAPSLTVVRDGSAPSIFNAIMVIHLQGGETLSGDSKTRVGDFLRVIQLANPLRHHVYGILTNLEECQLHRADKVSMAYSPPLRFDADGWSLLLGLLVSRSESELGMADPFCLDVGGTQCKPLDVLGTREGVIVYKMRYMGQYMVRAVRYKMKACKVSYEDHRTAAHERETAALSAIKMAGGSPHLPALHYAKPMPEGALLTTPVVKPIKYLTFRRLTQLVSAIQRLHEVGYVHRNLKPEHVCEDDDGNIVVIDLGSAAPLNDEEKRSPTVRYSGTLVYGCYGPMESIARGEWFVPPDIRQDLIPLVKTVYALIWEPRMHAISELESRFSDHDYEGRLELTKRFWEDEWPDTNPAGRRWRQIIKLAASGQDPFPYDELCDMLAVHVPACA